MKNNSFESLLEVIPKDIASSASEVTFITKSQVIKEDPIFEVNKDDLTNGQYVYYIHKGVDVKSIEKTDSVAFAHNVNSGSAMNVLSGFSVLVDYLPSEGILVYVIWVVFIIVILLFVGYTIMKSKRRKIRRNSQNKGSFADLKNAMRLQ